MTENEFDKLWQRAEVEGYSQRLAAEYPGWRRKRQRTIGMVTASLSHNCNGLRTMRKFIVTVSAPPMRNGSLWPQKY